MDEADLLGAVDGESDAAGQISQEEEDALLNGDFAPTTATAAAAADAASTPVAAAADEAIDDPPAEIVDPPAEVAEPKAVADEDELMNDDSESSKSSEERRERSQDVPISSNASETDEVDLQANRVTAENLRSSAYIRSMLCSEKERREEFTEKLKKWEQRIFDRTASQLSRMEELQEEQSNLSKQMKELQTRLSQLDPQPASQQAPVTLPLILPNTMHRPPIPTSAQRLQQLVQQRKQQRTSGGHVAGPSTSGGVTRRFSLDGAQPSTGLLMQRTQRTHHVARKSTGRGPGRGPLNGGAGPSRAVVQPQRAQTIANAQQAVAAASATAAARMLAAASSPLQQVAQRQLQQPTPNKMSPHANQAVSSPGANATGRVVLQQQMSSNQRPAVFNAQPRPERQTATIAPQSQQAAAISAALAAGDAAASGSRPAAAIPTLQQLQQLNRKRPHSMGDGHPGLQPMQQARNGQLLQHVQPQRQMSLQQPSVMRAAQQLQQQQAVQQRPPPAYSPDADPELRRLADYINNCFQKQYTDPTMAKQRTTAYSLMHAACRLEVRLRDARNATLPSIVMDVPTIDASFAVPSEGSATRSKISVDVPAWTLGQPFKRPSADLPIEAVARKGEHAPRVEFGSDIRDFMASGKLSGTVHFTPTSDWPENTARICIFYYIGTQNLGVWNRSEFATADFKERDANGNFKEATVKFTISLDKTSYFAKSERGAVNPNTKLESFVVVPVAACGAQVVRGEEATFDCGALDLADIRARYDKMLSQLRAFVLKDQREGGRPAQPPAARPARPAAAGDDIIEL